MTDYLLLTLAVTLLSGCFAMSRLYQQREGDGLLAGLRYTALLGAVTAFAFWGVCGFSVSLTLFSLLMAVTISTLVTLYTLIGFRLMKSGGLALYTMFLMAGGMIVPYVWGLLFWEEDFSILRTAGLLLLLAALVFSNWRGRGERVNLSQIAMCLCVFSLNGMTSVCSKLHQMETVLPTVRTDEFVVWSAASKCIIAGLAWGVLWLMSRKQTRKVLPREKGGRRWIFMLPIGMAALLDGASYMLQLSAASRLPATVLYPFVTGGSMILTALAGVLFFRERLTNAMKISLCLCLAGTLLFL